MATGRICRVHRTVVPLSGCPRCADEDNRRRTEKSSSHGVSTARWRRRRAAKLRRDPVCQLEADDLCAFEATTVHVPAEYRGDHDACPDDELVSACAHCHGVVDGPRAHGARA